MRISERTPNVPSLVEAGGSALPPAARASASRRLPAFRLSRAIGLVAPWAIVALALGIRRAAGPHITDDAYITFRYARNLAEGFGFVYNPGEHVLGTTTPLYTLLLAASYLLGGHDLPGVAVAVNSVADAATTYLLFVLALRLGWGRSGRR